MNKIKTRHTRRAMRAKRRGKHTTRKWYGKYKKNYTRKIVKQIQGQGKGRLRRQRQTRRKVGGLTKIDTIPVQDPIALSVNNENVKSVNQYDELPVTEEPVTKEPVTTTLQNAPENDEYSSLTTEMIKKMLTKRSFDIYTQSVLKYYNDETLLNKIRTRFIEFIKRKKNEKNFPYDIDFFFDEDVDDIENLEIKDLLNDNELLETMLKKMLENSMFFMVDNLVEKIKVHNTKFLNDETCYENIIRTYIKNKLFRILITLISKIRNEPENEKNVENIELLLDLLKKMSEENMTLLHILLNEMSDDNMGKLLRLLESMTPESISKLISDLKILEEQKIKEILKNYIELNKNHSSMAQLLELYSFIERTPNGVFLVHRYKDGKTPLGQSLLRNKKHKLETCSSVAALDNQVKNVSNQGALRFTEDNEFKKVLAECSQYPPSQQVTSGGRKRRTLKKKRRGKSK